MPPGTPLIDADETVAILKRRVTERGHAPANLRCDNGPELTGRVLAEWCQSGLTETAYIDPGAPWQNAWVEFFNARLRDELLDVEEFSTLAEPQNPRRRLPRRLQHQPPPLGAWHDGAEKQTDQSTPNSHKGWTDEQGPVRASGVTDTTPERPAPFSASRK